MRFSRPFRRLVVRPRLDPAAIARDVDDELSFHLEMRARELVERGMSAAAARARARAEFGDVAATRRQLAADGRVMHDHRRRNAWWSDFLADIRFAVRQLRRAPSFTAVAVTTLALGIGASTAIMSVVRGIVLQPLPFGNPSRLVALYSTTESGRRGSMSVPDFADFRTAARTFAEVAAYYRTTTNLVGAGEPQRLTAARVDANWFRLLGVRPLIGRAFVPGEDGPGSARVAVLTESLWRRLYGGDATVIGRSMSLDGNPVEIVGVAADAAGLPEGVELWTTTRFAASEFEAGQRGARWIRVLGRLADGATLSQANEELAAVARRLEEQDPRHNTGYSAAAVPLHEALVGTLRRPLFVLLGAAGVLLLIACINVAGLLLARAAARDTELAVRTAIGAGRGRLVRQLVTEAIVLGGIAGTLGIAVAMVATRLLVRLAPPGTPRLANVEVDGVMLLFALAAAAATGFLFGLLPALQGARGALTSRLKEAGRGAVGKSRVTRVRRVLVVAELALAVMLLAGAGLLFRTFAKLSDVHPGFDASRLTAFTVVLPESDYGTLESQRRFLREAESRIAALPGVAAAGASFGLPLTDTRFSLSFTIEGRPEPAPDEEPSGQLRVATPDYFRAMGIPLLRGRSFTAEDRLGAPRVMIISDALARRYFPDEDPIGKRIRAGWTRDSMRLGGEIIGIVGDVRQFGPRQAPPPAYYAAADQWPTDEIVFVVKASTGSVNVLPALRGVVRGLDEHLPLFDVRQGDDLVWRSLSEPRFYLWLLGAFAGVALVLGAVGIYGVIAYTVRQRTREIGVRMALGASSGRILRMVMGEGVVLAVAGVALGIMGASQLTRVLAKMLYGVEPNDIATLGVVAILLALVAVVSCLVPARAASRMNPQGSLRVE